MYAALSAALCTVATSCDSDDDGNEGGGSVVPPTEASNFGGERLTSVSNDYGYNITFSYNSDGSLRQVNDDDSKIIFDYSKGILTFSDDDTHQEARFTTNDKGYITGFSCSQSYNDEGSKYESKVSYQFKYNGGGHLISVICNEEETYRGSKDVTDITWSLSWNGDLLTTVDIKGSYKSPSEGIDDKWSTVNDFTYDQAPDNNYMQYTNAIIDAIDLDGDIEAPMFAGILGKGPSKYPTKIVTNCTDDEDTSTEEQSYDINAKGLVETEYGHQYDGYGEYDWSVSYGYGSASKVASRSNGKSVDKIIRHGNPRNHVSLFKRLVA